MTTEPPDDQDDRPDDDVGADEGAAARSIERVLRLPADLQALVEEIVVANMAKVMSPTISRFRFERFEVLDYMIGGMGLVLQAFDPELRRMVAIKLWIRDGEQAQQFLRAEARALAQLSHPNVVTIYEIGTWMNRVYFVMEWVDGVDGARWMRKRRSWREIRDVFLQAARGLAAAHDAGVVHRDFKPHNMLIGSDGRVRVSDFGIAEWIDGDTPGRVLLVGTTQYLAPEQLIGRAGDALSDQFSFCVSLWQVLYGTLPFEGATTVELLEAMYDGFLEADLDDPDRPEWLMLTALYGFAFRPDERYPSMHRIIRALEEERAPADDEDESGEGGDDEGGEGGNGDGEGGNEDGEGSDDDVGDEDPPVLHEPGQPLGVGRGEVLALDLEVPHSPLPEVDDEHAAGLGEVVSVEPQDLGDDERDVVGVQSEASSPARIGYGSAPPPPQATRWIAAAFGGGLALGLVGVLAFMAGSWWSTQVLERAPRESEELREAVATDDVPITPEQVIEHIEAGTYDTEIHERWTAEETRRTSLKVPTYYDNLRISEAFLQRFEALKERDQVAARQAASYAMTWSTAARTNLNRHAKSTSTTTVTTELDDVDERIRKARVALGGG